MDTTEATADTLARDAVGASVQRALLAVLRPGALVDFDPVAVIRRVEYEHGVVLRVTTGARGLIHEALSAGTASIDEFCAHLPRAFAVALRDIRADDATIDTWAAIAARWQRPHG